MRRTYIDADIFNPAFKNKLKNLEKLPSCCWESANRLQAKQNIFEKNNVFPSGTLDAIIKKLMSHEDNGLNKPISGNMDKIMEVVEKYIHCM